MNMIVLSVSVLRYMRTIVVDPDLLLSVFNWPPGSLIFYQRFKEIEQGHGSETLPLYIWKQIKLKIYCLLFVQYLSEQKCLHF